MRTRGQVEPFGEFAKLDVGIPFLRFKQNRKTAHVSWSDGTLHHYHEFRAALEAAPMEKELMEVWERYKPQISRRTEFGHGSTSGCLVYAPIAMALEMREIALLHYSRALETVANRIRTGTTCLDELHHEMDSRRHADAAARN